MFEHLEDGTFVVASTALEHGTSLTFADLSSLKEEIDALVGDETSRILQAELMGDYVCDGCTI